MGTQLPSPKRGQSPPPNFGPISIVVKPLYVSGTTWYGGRPQPMRHCVTWGPSSPSPKREQPPILANIRCGQTVGWTKMPLDMEVGLGPGDFAFDGDPAPPENRAQPPPIFGPCLLWLNRWMDQGATFYGGKPRPRRRCIRWGRSSP